MLRGAAQAFRGLLVASAFFFFWLGAVVLAWALSPFARLIYREGADRWRACQRIARIALHLFHGYMRRLTLLDVHVEADATRPPGPLIVVSNHPTLVDVTAILAAYGDVCCVVKSSLMRNVFVGPLLRACGHVDAGDGEALSGAAVVQEAQRRLAAGMAVLIFPEGTRSPRAGMHPFRRGAFELALRSGVDIWPLVVTCNPPALSKGLPFWKQPETVAHLRIHPEALLASPTDARAARRSVEALFRERLGISAQEAVRTPESTARPTAPRARLPEPRGEDAPRSA